MQGAGFDLGGVCGEQGELGEGDGGGLGIQIEETDGFDLVSKKFNANGLRVWKTEEVEDAATDGDLAALRDLRDDFEAVFLEVCEEGVAVELVSDADGLGGVGEGVGFGYGV